MENWYSMEENNKHTNNSDRNIFYEYFNKLEKANIDFEVPKFEEIEEAYNNTGSFGALRGCSSGRY